MKARTTGLIAGTALLALAAGWLVLRGEAQVAPSAPAKPTETAAKPAPIAARPIPPGPDDALLAAEKSMRAAGASADDIERMRAAAVPPKGGERLATLVKAESAWNARVGSYLLERDRLGGASDTPDAAQLAALQRLRDSRFTREEQTLLSTYEKGPTPQLMPPD